MNFINFFLFLGVIFVLLDPHSQWDSDPSSTINADPYRSGSETLQNTHELQCFVLNPDRIRNVFAVRIHVTVLVSKTHETIKCEKDDVSLKRSCIVANAIRNNMLLRYTGIGRAVS